MPERRRHLRVPMIGLTPPRVGQIISHEKSLAIDCVIEDLSVGGACLQLAETAAIPEKFELLINPGGVRRFCRLAWKTANRIGVSF